MVRILDEGLAGQTLSDSALYKTGQPIAASSSLTPNALHIRGHTALLVALRIRYRITPPPFCKFVPDPPPACFARNRPARRHPPDGAFAKRVALHESEPPTAAPFPAPRLFQRSPHSSILFVDAPRS